MNKTLEPNPFDTLTDDPDIQPRLTPMDRTKLDPEHLKIHDGIVDSVRKIGEMSNGALPGPFNAWMYVSTTLTTALDNVGVAIRTETTDIPALLKEIAVCVVAAHRRCNVAFWAHAGIASTAGLSTDVIEDLKHRRPPAFVPVSGISVQEQQTMYRFVNMYLEKHRVTDELYESLLVILGSERAMVQLVLVIGHYCNIAAQLNILRVPAPGKEQPFPKPTDPSF